jgi:hypothetical protein
MELGINNNTSSNTTYKPTSFDKDEILANHRSFITSLNIPFGKEFEERKVHSGIINVFNERIVYSPDKDSVCSKRGTTEIL